MNAIVPIQVAQLPAHLQALASRSNLASNAMGGITMGTPINQISIKGSRWRKQDTQGNEEVIPHLHLDVIIADANPNLSKVFYLGAYNPADTEAKAPDCWSDNGIAPSSKAQKPQCDSCAACPHAVWGSKITPTGAQTKACGDSKKLAVVLADNPDGAVFLLRVPAASLKNLYAFVESIASRGIPLPAIVVRLTFDASADFPKILFTALGWSSEIQMAALTKVLGTKEIETVIGTNDVPKPAGGAPALPAAASIAAPVPAPVPVTPASFLDTPTRVPVAPMASFLDAQPPAAAAPIPMTQAQIDAAIAAGVAAQLAEQPVKAKRTRKPKDEAPASPDLGASPTQAATTPAAPADTLAELISDIPQHMNAASAVVTHPKVTDTALDNLLAAALKV